MLNLKEVLKPNKYGTIRKNAVLKLIKQGLLEAKCEYHMTDDYAFDNAVNFKRSDYLPARIMAESVNEHGRIVNDRKEGVMNFSEDDFSSSYKTGGARLQNDGTIRFYVHSNLCYTLRVKA